MKADALARIFYGFATACQSAILALRLQGIALSPAVCTLDGVLLCREVISHA